MGYSSKQYVLENCESPTDEIIRFVLLAQSARFTVSEFCEQFGISRKTGYKHLERYSVEGFKGLSYCPGSRRFRVSVTWSVFLTEIASKRRFALQFEPRL